MTDHDRLIREVARIMGDAYARELTDWRGQHGWPALRDVQGQFRICDRTGLDRIRPARQPSVWRPVLSDAPASSAVRTDGRTDATLDRLAALIRAGVTREEARAQGYEFANDDWTRARREVEAESELLNGLLVASQGNGLRATLP